MASIHIENSEDHRSVRFRVTGVGHLLEAPALVIRWHGANTILGTRGWANAAASHPLSQKLEGQDLILSPDPVIASFIDPGTPIEIEIPALQAVIEPLRWPSLGPGLNILIGKAGDTISAGKTTTPPPPPPPPPPKVIQQIAPPVTDSTEKRDEKDATAKLPTANPGGKKGGFPWAATLAFLIGCGAGAGGLFGVGAYQKANSDLVRPSASAAARCDLQALSERAYLPLQIGLQGLAKVSPKGKKVEDVAAASAPDRARRLYSEGQRDSQSSGKISEESVFWFRQAAQMCDAQSLYSLGRAYWSGEGVATSDQIAGFQLMRLSDALGFAGAREYLRKLIQQKEVRDLPQSIEQRYQR